VRWQGDTMTDLGALFGGYDTWALSVNSRGEIVGDAYNTIPDANSMFGYGYQSRAFCWKNGSQTAVQVGSGSMPPKIGVNGGSQRGYWALGAYPPSGTDTIITKILP